MYWIPVHGAPPLAPTTPWAQRALGLPPHLHQVPLGHQLYLVDLKISPQPHSCPQPALPLPSANDDVEAQRPGTLLRSTAAASPCDGLPGLRDHFPWPGQCSQLYFAEGAGAAVLE